MGQKTSRWRPVASAFNKVVPSRPTRVYSHLDRLRRFCRTHECDQYIDRRLHVNTSVEIARIYAVTACDVG